MKSCEKCGKAFNPKKDTAKYCSDSCRVMACRNRQKKGAVTTSQLQVVYNAILDLLASSRVELPTNLVSGKSDSLLHSNGSVTPFTMTRQKTVEEWIAAKREIPDNDEYQRWLSELEADQYLSSKQKSLIKNA